MTEQEFKDIKARAILARIQTDAYSHCNYGGNNLIKVFDQIIELANEGRRTLS